MRNKRLFLRWVLMASLTLVATAIAFRLNLFSEVYRLDASKISFIILAVFCAGMVRCGMLTWNANTLIDYDQRKTPFLAAKAPAGLKKIANQADHVWFATHLCEKLGYLGTIIGLVMAFASLDSLEGTDPASLKKFLQNFAGAMFTAAITTVVGIVCGILLSLQCQNLSNAIDRVLGEKND